MRASTVKYREAGDPPLGTKAMCGFWRRIFALIIDGLILGLIGMILGFFLFEYLSQLGGWGRLVGFFIALFYFGLLNSSLGGGQTYGKRAVSIQVVNTNGNLIPVGRSFLRAVILITPFFLNNAPITISSLKQPVGILIGCIVFVIGGATIYLYIFNRLTRQTPADLVVKTFVVGVPVVGKIPREPVWKKHYVVIGAFSLIVLVLSLIGPYVYKPNIFTNMIGIQKKIEETGKVRVVTLATKKWFSMSGKSEWNHETIESRVILKTQPDNYDETIKEIASIIIRDYPNVMKKSSVTVTMSYGYDIGISSNWKSTHTQYSPQEWQKILAKDKQTYIDYSEFELKFEEGL